MRRVITVEITHDGDKDPISFDEVEDAVFRGLDLTGFLDRHKKVVVEVKDDSTHVMRAGFHRRQSS